MATDPYFKSEWESEQRDRQALRKDLAVYLQIFGRDPNVITGVTQGGKTRHNVIYDNRAKFSSPAVSTNRYSPIRFQDGDSAGSLKFMNCQIVTGVEWENGIAENGFLLHQELAPKRWKKANIPMSLRDYLQIKNGEVRKLLDSLDPRKPRIVVFAYRNDAGR